MTIVSPELQQQLDRLKDWDVVEGHHLRRIFRFRDFCAALAWVNLAGATCEAQGHHADFLLRWGSVQVEIFTHDTDGLSAADPRLAIALDALPQEVGVP
ncbi:MAG: 4a-hydroxytetrahydrobiopterin dehydratase [Cyanobacteriota bacterium]